MKAFALTMLLLAALKANGTVFTSPSEQTHLIELYTSEGCSSCPPADRRMNRLTEEPGLWEKFVPVAFHVDYWNNLGWHDRFSKPEFTARQRRYSKSWKARTIYTPCFVVDGVAKRFPNIPGGNGLRGILRAEIKDRNIHISFEPAVPSTIQLTAYAVPLGGIARTKVAAGENRGRTLDHRFVALGLASAETTPKGSVYVATLPFERAEATKGIAVWVANSETLAPIQATGGWLD